jgi:hypothetical protein
MMNACKLMLAGVLVVPCLAVAAAAAAPGATPKKTPARAKAPAKALVAPGPAAPGPMRQKMLAGPMAGVEDIIFAERVSGTDHWYANFGFYAASVAEYPPPGGLPDEKIPPLFGSGGRLCRLHLRTGKVTVLLDDRAACATRRSTTTGAGSCSPTAKAASRTIICTSCGATAPG